MIRNKKVINIISLILLSVLIYICFSNSLLDTNLSRIANTSNKMYLFLIIYSLLFGVFEFIVLKAFGYGKEKFIGLISMLIGIIYPYNYQETSSLNTNIHLLLAFSSIVLISYSLILCIKYLKNINSSLSNKLLKAYLLMMYFNLFMYTKFMYINSLSELIFLSVIIIEQTYAYNII